MKQIVIDQKTRSEVQMLYDEAKLYVSCKGFFDKKYANRPVDARLFRDNNFELFFACAKGAARYRQLAFSEGGLTYFGEFADGGYEYAGKCFISNAGCYDDARAVADLIEEQFPNLNGKVVINSVGTTIGSHTGPGTVALFFWGSKREN